MVLSDEVREALERVRLIDNGESAESVRGTAAWQKWTEDKMTLSLEMLRIFPPGYFDPITPERLVEAGFDDMMFYKIKILVITVGDYQMQWWSKEKELHIRVAGTTVFPAEMTGRFAPRNMGEVLELIERCKEGM